MKARRVAFHRSRGPRSRLRRAFRLTDAPPPSTIKPGSGVYLGNLGFEMNSALTSIILLAVLVSLGLLGQRLRRRLPEHHLSADSKDAVKLTIGLVATMTALLLGLLVSSAKGAYDTRRTEVIEIAAKITLLDRLLTAYGPDAAEARARFRELGPQPAGQGVGAAYRAEPESAVTAAGPAGPGPAVADRDLQLVYRRV